ncbi:Ig-like and fibronectin type-III domain-containing protein [Dirofilaria immitis]|nr:Ig-like and fibronectin type-III domain-containing protein [Dirofilaria immitis]
MPYEEDGGRALMEVAGMNKKRKQPRKNTVKRVTESSSNDDDVCKIVFPSCRVREIKPKRVTFESDVLKVDLQTKFLCLFPDEFFIFWKHAQMLAGKDGDPCGKFLYLETAGESCVFGSLKFLRLCGVFDYLAGHLKDADTEKCLVYDRFATDLPEMQTLAVYNAGRFNVVITELMSLLTVNECWPCSQHRLCFGLNRLRSDVYYHLLKSPNFRANKGILVFRDEPNTEKPLIVHVDNAEHFPKCVIVEHYKMFITNVKTIVKSRKKETVGFPFHGIGIHVKIVNNVGYRPLMEKTGKLKDLITFVATASSEAAKQKKLEKIMEIISYVQFANDEKDFGMGLEFGHDIFWSNYDFFDKMAEKVLTMAYKLLNRGVFARILEDTVYDDFPSLMERMNKIGNMSDARIGRPTCVCFPGVKDCPPVVHMWLLLFLFVYNVCNGVGAIVVGQCCRKRGNPPNDFDVYNIFERKLNCQPYMNAISECLADGRDHIHCCMNEAKDRDENACFGMCRGEGIDGISAWDKYQTCLAINLHPMFRCFERGYLNIPSSPLSLHIVSKSTDSVVLSWSPPAVNSNLAESYQVICKEADSGLIEKQSILGAIKLRLQVYALIANIRVVAYRETVAIPGDASSVTVACRMEMPGTTHKSAHFEWKKIQEKTGHYEKVGGDKYSFTNYISSHEHPRHYVSVLQIRFLKPSDFGTYRCIATNDFGSSSADIRVMQRMLTSATPIPPEPPYTCCQRMGIRSPCVAVCGSEFGKHASLRAESFINSHCEDEISKFLTCTTAGVDEGACCLRKKVPDNRPATVSGLKAFPDPDGDLLLRWDLTPRADMYHVYWKRKFSTTWELSSVVTTSKRIYGNAANDIDEIVVVASNSFGNAHPVRLIHSDDKWTASTISNSDLNIRNYHLFLKLYEHLQEYGAAHIRHSRMVFVVSPQTKTFGVLRRGEELLRFYVREMLNVINA